MSKFKVGDRVKIVSEISGSLTDEIGKTTSIESVDSYGGYHLKGISGGGWQDCELELVTKKENKMGKYYRVQKDTPGWLAGAIIQQLEPSDSNDKNPDYRAISDLWEPFEEGYPTDYVELADIVENSPEWFVRVYDVKVLGKIKYLTKEKAREVHNKLYKGDDK